MGKVVQMAMDKRLPGIYCKKVLNFDAYMAETNLVQRHQFRFENQSQARKVRWQYHEILMAHA